MIDEHPTRCNLCDGEVVYTDSGLIYGRSYGMIYLCKNCGGYVGVHRGTDRAMGILANDEMRFLRKLCHAVFDKRWSTKPERTEQYVMLADELGIGLAECHFGHFDKKMLLKALRILEKR